MEEIKYKETKLVQGGWSLHWKMRRNLSRKEQIMHTTLQQIVKPNKFGYQMENYINITAYNTTP